MIKVKDREKAIRYLQSYGEIDKIPKPDNSNDEYFLNVRNQAIKLLNAWKVNAE